MINPHLKIDVDFNVPSSTGVLMVDVQTSKQITLIFLLFGRYGESYHKLNPPAGVIGFPTRTTPLPPAGSKIGIT
jgi:hypothetical protein